MARFQEILARDFSDPLYFRSHRLTVDTYCLQHPGRYCKSAKSLAAHLVGLCAILEEGTSRATGPDKLHRWLNGARDLQKPDLPDWRGHMTVGNLPMEADPSGWGEAVLNWATATWTAYSDLHEVARQWRRASEHGS